MKSIATQDGFTIIELLIALAVFSVVLMVVVVALIGFTTDYFKGLTSSAAQTTTNNIEKIVAQSIELGSYSQAANAYCTGNEEFYYQPGVEYPNSPDALIEFPLPINDSCTTSPGPILLASGKSLLGDYMRLLKFSITQPNSSTEPQLYAIDIEVAYASGGSAANPGIDLLCSSTVAPGASGGCSANALDVTISQINAPDADIVCKTTVGSQFCDVAELSTLVYQR